MPKLETVHVAAAIIVRGDRVLACRRGGVGPFAGGWELPGGKVREGESAFDACRREVDEELGVRVGTTYLYDTVEHDYPDFHLSMDCYVCHLRDGEEPRALEHSEMRWLSREELGDVDWLPADRDLVAGLAFAWDQVFVTEPM